MLSALAHGGEPQHRAVIDVLAEALSFVEVGRAVSYTELVLASLPQAAKDYWEALVSVETYPYLGEYSRGLIERGRSEGRSEGQVEATAKSVLTTLEVRGIAVSAEDRTRILGCSDLTQLELWQRQAVQAESVGELLG